MSAANRTTLRVVRADGTGGSSPEPIQLGPRIRAIRQRMQWTLAEASEKTGIAKSTLSKIENDRMSPTFEAMQQLARGLGIDIPQMFQPSREQRGPGRRIVTRMGEGRLHPTGTYEHELLCTALTPKRMIPYKSRIRARDVAEFSEWVRHDGEEFMLVLEGTVRLHTEFYEPTDLGEGDSVYYDSGMGHMVVSVSEEDALVVWLSIPDALGRGGAAAG